jgi:hypothetical protein
VLRPDIELPAFGRGLVPVRDFRDYTSSNWAHLRCPMRIMDFTVSKADACPMAECCDRAAYDQTFGDRFARRIARRCRKRGLDATRSGLIEFLSAHGIEDATVLEIGGGIGELHVELLRRGARAATNLEISTGYEQEPLASSRDLSLQNG